MDIGQIKAKEVKRISPKTTNRNFYKAKKPSH